MPQFIDDLSKYDMPSATGNFLKLEDGSNKLRLCTKPLEVPYHEIPGAKYATQVCPGNGCELCKLNKPKKYKFAFQVLNRKDGKPYIYEAPLTVFKQLVLLDNDPEYGDFREYDITITKEGIGRNTTYSIMPSPKKSEITDEEVKLMVDSGISLETAYALEK